MSLVIRASVALSLVLSSILPGASAQQSGQSGSGTGTNTSTSQRLPGSQPGTGSQPRQRSQRLIFISGTVLQEDGTPPPPGAVIERTCFGRTSKQAYVNSLGAFSFQVGNASATSIMPDASDSSFGGFDPMMNPSPQRSAIFAPTDVLTSAEFVGCELKAALPGYTSSTVTLDGSGRGGHVDVGTIILHPVERVTGTTVSVTSMQAPKKAQKALRRAQEALGRHKLEEAEQRFRAVVTSFPGYAEAWYGLGMLYQDQKRVADARQAFGKALEADSRFVKPQIELARLAGMERNWKEVADITDRALALNPLDFPEGFFMNSLANYHLAKPDASEKSARRALRLDNSHRFPQVHLLLALILQQRNDGAGEAEQLRHYLKHAPPTAITERQRDRLKTLENRGLAAVGQPAHP